MSIQYIQTDNILVDGSRFNLKKALFGIEESDPALTRSLQELGILSPVTVLKDSSGRYYLIDGFKRVRFALDTSLSAVEAVVLPDSTVVEEVISMILHDKRSIITESVMNKVCFVSFTVALKATEEWILNDLCKTLELRPHRSILEECERMSALPHELKSFCHEKKFSLKQMLNLSHHPEDLLMQLMSWRQVLQLTASVLDEMASNLRDHLRSNDITIDEFSSEREIEELIGSDISNRDRTERLRSIIRMRRFPVLTEVNDRIERVINELGLPGEIEIVWDKTLENRRVEFRIHVNNAVQWEEIMDAMRSPAVESALNRILDQL
jgi:hypothetical protein